jgi:hypothetical protein
MKEQMIEGLFARFRSGDCDLQPLNHLLLPDDIRQALGADIRILVVTAHFAGHHALFIRHDRSPPWRSPGLFVQGSILT